LGTNAHPSGEKVGALDHQATPAALRTICQPELHHHHYCSGTEGCVSDAPVSKWNDFGQTGVELKGGIQIPPEVLEPGWQLIRFKSRNATSKHGNFWFQGGTVRSAHLWARVAIRGPLQANLSKVRMEHLSTPHEGIILLHHVFFL
jgi:hypothetical protein